MPAPQTEVEKQRISFYHLPAELRVMVHEHFSSIFKAGGKPRVVSLKGLRTRYDYFSRHLLPLLLTSKQIRDEVQDGIAKRSPILHNSILHLVSQQLAPPDPIQRFDSFKASPTHVHTNGYSCIEVPPKKFWPVVQRLKLTVKVPSWLLDARVTEERLGRKLVDGEQPWSLTDMDWLFLVRKTNEWTEHPGSLELLQVEIYRSDRSRGYWDRTEEGRALKEWTEIEIETLSHAARDTEIVFTTEY